MADIKEIAVVTNIPNPYRIPLFNELDTQLKNRGIKLSVIFGTRDYKRRKFSLDISSCKFDYYFLNSFKISFGNSEKTIFTYKGLLKILKKLQPDKIIIIGFSIGTLKLWVRSFWNKTPIMIWSGSIVNKNRSYSPFRTLFRVIIVKRVSGFIAYGTKTKGYLQTLGVKENNINIAINTVDTDFFYRRTLLLRKKEFNESEKKILTFIGYLVPRKGVRQLLDIVCLLQQQRNDFLLEIIGDGSEREKLEKYVIEKNISEYVTFVGFKQKNELPEYLARSNCFLFQTDFDIWGLVLNEAMAAGVPCIASIHAGATHDLIVEGKTGFSIDFSDIRKVTETINWIFDHPDEAEEIGKNASRFVKKNASLKKSVEGFMEAIITT